MKRRPGMSAPVTKASPSPVKAPAPAAANNRFLAVARQAPPATWKRKRKSLYDDLEPAVLSLIDEKGYSRKSALTMLLDADESRRYNPAERSVIYRNICARIKVVMERRKAAAKRSMEECAR